MRPNKTELDKGNELRWVSDSHTATGPNVPTNMVQYRETRFVKSFEAHVYTMLHAPNSSKRNNYYVQLIENKGFIVETDTCHTHFVATSIISIEATH